MSAFREGDLVQLWEPVEGFREGVVEQTDGLGWYCVRSGSVAAGARIWRHRDDLLLVEREEK